MDPNAKKEQFSNAFVYAIAAAAGYRLAKYNVDDDSIDWLLGAAGGKGTVKSPRLELQLKCTSVPDILNGVLRYDLPVKNYNDLIPVDLAVPRILVLVIVPDEVADWLQCNDDAYILRHCAYWVALRGLAESDNVATVRIELPLGQRFDVQSLDEMMGRLGAGGLP